MASITFVDGTTIIPATWAQAVNNFFYTLFAGATTAAQARTALGLGSAALVAVPVTVANGGTGLSTLTANNVLLGNGTSNVAFVAPGTSGNYLTSNGTTWVSTSPSAATPVSIVGNAQTTTYTILATDVGKLITGSGTFTVNLTAAATLGSGFWCWVKNIGTGVLTLDPNGSELIRFPGGLQAGDTTMTLPYSGTSTGPYNVSGILLWCNGTGFEVISTLETHGEFSITATGAYSWTPPAGVTAIFIDAAAAGGGGGATNTGANAGGGGGGGESFLGKVASVTPGIAVTGSVGVAGTAGASGGANGGAGGNTTIVVPAGTLTLTGGGGGTNDSSGGAGGSGGGGIAGGAGGSGTSGGGSLATAQGGASMWGTGGSTGMATAIVGCGFGAGGAGRAAVGGAGAAGTQGFVRFRW